MKNLLVSFSGGETSAYMSQWLKRHYKELGYENIVFVFANTGLENQETLEFVDRCDKHFGLNVHWVEAKVIFQAGVGTTYTITNFENANRNGYVFEQFIKKYGIPNQASPQCSRELKQRPIHACCKDYFEGQKYDTAIGIRKDEFDRMNADRKKLRLIYPLIDAKMLPATKPMVNFFWKQMPFRLNLKGYQGNCATCWKKSDKKLWQIAKESPEKFDFMARMEQEYGNYFPPQRIERYNKEGKPIPQNIKFFRGERSVEDILRESKNFNGIVKNDAENYAIQQELFEDESCDIYTKC
jgi:hypothetical protein